MQMRLVMLWLAMLLLVSCADKNAQPAAPTGRAIQPMEALKERVMIGAVENRTGSSTGSMIDSTTFKNALEKTMIANDILTPEDGTPLYQINADITYNRSAAKTFDYECTLQATYSLVEKANSKTVLSKTINTKQHFENPVRKEHGVVATALYMAVNPGVNQQAIDSCISSTTVDNIEQFMRAISKSSVTKPVHHRKKKKAAPASTAPHATLRRN